MCSLCQSNPLIQIKSEGIHDVHPGVMVRSSDWEYASAIAASLALAVGAICVLLFAL
jgi:hypothetical protein